MSYDQIPNRPLTSLERRIVRSALKHHADRIEKLAKNLADNECSNDAQLDMVHQIRGDDHSSGLMGVFTEQLSIVDQAQLSFEDTRRALEGASRAVAKALVDMPDFPPGPAPYITELERFIRTWSDEQRRVALQYAIAAGELKEGEVMTEPMPERVRQALSRAREWTLSDDDREHWLARGPYDVTWENDIGTGGLLFYARRTDVTGEGAERQETFVPDLDRFATEGEARSCAARLNREWYLTMQGETYPAQGITSGGDVETTEGAVPDPATGDLHIEEPSEEEVTDRARSLQASEGSFEDAIPEAFITRARAELIEEARIIRSETAPTWMPDEIRETWEHMDLTARTEAFHEWPMPREETSPAGIPDGGEVVGETSVEDVAEAEQLPAAETSEQDLEAEQRAPEAKKGKKWPRTHKPKESKPKDKKDKPKGGK